MRDVVRLLAGAIIALACVAWVDSPLRAPTAGRLKMLAVAPQFWGYFGAPRQEQIEVFRWKSGGWQRADAPLGAPANLFGLRRSTPNHGAEFRTIEGQLGTRWSSAMLGPSQLPETDDEPLPIRSLARRPQLCGDLLVISRPPVPWAWAHSGTRVTLPTRYVRLNVQC